MSVSVFVTVFAPFFLAVTPFNPSLCRLLPFQLSYVDPFKTMLIVGIFFFTAILGAPLVIYNINL